MPPVKFTDRVKQKLKSRGSSSKKVIVPNDTNLSQAGQITSAATHTSNRSLGPKSSPAGNQPVPVLPGKLCNVPPVGQPIRELWHVAYEELRNAEKELVQKFEEKVSASLPTGLASTAGFNDQKREQMNTIVRRKIEEVDREAWRIKFGSSDVLVKDLLASCVGIVTFLKKSLDPVLDANPYTSIAWMGVGLLLPLLLNPSEQATSLGKGLEYIATLVAQSRMREDLYLRRYESKTNDGKLSQLSHDEYKNALKMLYRSILKFQMEIYCYFVSNSASRLGKDTVKWNDWESLLNEIHRQEETFEHINKLWKDAMYDEECAKAEERHQENKGRWDIIGEDVSGLRRAIELAQEEKKRDELLKWLSDVDNSEGYNVSRKMHEAGTSEWLVSDSIEFTHWEETPRSFLWLHGKAGSGKSVLSSSVISHFKERYNDDPNGAVAYFFFSFNDKRKQNVDEMLASLIRQLCTRRPNTPKAVERCREYMEKGERPDTTTLQAALLSAIQGFSATYFIIDALDECPTVSGGRRNLLDSLHYLIRSAPDDLHIFCTSRKEADIATSLRTLVSSPVGAQIDLVIQRKAVDVDIGLYIDSMFARSEFESWNLFPEEKGKAREKLVEKADGMFLYVHYQVEKLAKCVSVAQVTKVLDNLPPGLDGIFNRILEGIDPDMQPQVHSALMWLAFSTRPLLLEELAEIFVIRTERAVPELEVDARPFHPRDALKCFSSLILEEMIYDPRRGEVGFTYHGVNVVRLFHFSIKEYLTSDRINNGPAARFGFSEVKAQKHIAHSCLAYHLYCVEEATVLSNTQTEDAFWLKGYAGRHWITHLEMVPKTHWPCAVPLAATRALTPRSRSLLIMLQMSNNAISDQSWGPIPVSMLHRPWCFTARLGHLQLTQMLLDTARNEYLTQEDLDAALHESAYGGHTDIVKFMLKMGASANSEAAWFGTALHAAAARGHPRVIDALLQDGASIDAYGKNGVSALQLAVEHKQYAAVKRLVARGANINLPAAEGQPCILTQADSFLLPYLLDHGANIDMQDNRYGTPLHRLVESEYYDRMMIEMLLKRGANVNAKGGAYGYALQAACSTGNNVAIVRLLLDAGADINAVGGNFGTALQRACFTETKSDIVDLLLNRGADVNISGGTYGSPLIAACICGHWVENFRRVRRSPKRETPRNNIETIRKLISLGADVNYQGGFHGNALQAAAANCRADVVRFLLLEGADVNIVGGEYGTALQAAAASDSKEIVSMLLMHSADVHLIGGKFGTALRAGASRSSKDIVSLLLIHGAKVNTTGGNHGTALHLAATTPGSQKDPSADIARMLLDRGADVSAQDSFLGTPLHVAASTKYKAMVSLLLERGGDVNAKGGRFWTTLQAAVQHEATDPADRADIVHMLLDHGVEINARGGEYDTALQASCTTQNVDIPRLLIQHGADVHVSGGKYGSAWHAATHSHSQSIDTVQLLIEHGANVNDAGGEPYATALYAVLASDPGRVTEIYSFLLKNRVNVNTKAGPHGSALHFALCEWADGRWARRLLEDFPDINVNAQGGRFGNALQAAAYKGLRDVVELLLDRGADAKLRGGKYYSALNAAVVKGFWDIVEILLDHGAEPDNIFQQDPDEAWLRVVLDDDGRGAVERYRGFWEREDAGKRPEKRISREKYCGDLEESTWRLDEPDLGSDWGSDWFSD
ncbi:hypothetical protein PV10_05963 [Exophiala mesophila]|uniref:NACHT domain-containing protein n=1 Tax=Exophiala mesophila TaxID=212818 RepID=A0A0D1Z9N9_EXOME|nr:uncharacterized protein PV10_05963 [Exophiala mesophila]KIV91422.1 hypothetical protein PV10_05963 [Exophiala mesophila]